MVFVSLDVSARTNSLELLNNNFQRKQKFEKRDKIVAIVKNVFAYIIIDGWIQGIVIRKLDKQMSMFHTKSLSIANCFLISYSNLHMMMI